MNVGKNLHRDLYHVHNLIHPEFKYFLALISICRPLLYLDKFEVTTAMCPFKTFV